MYLIHTTEIFNPTNNYFYVQNKFHIFSSSSLTIRALSLSLSLYIYKSSFSIIEFFLIHSFSLSLSLSLFSKRFIFGIGSSFDLAFMAVTLYISFLSLFFFSFFISWMSCIQGRDSYIHMCQNRHVPFLFFLNVFILFFFLFVLGIFA